MCTGALRCQLIFPMSTHRASVLLFPCPDPSKLSHLTQTLCHTFWSILWLSTEAEDLCLFYIKAIQIHCPGFLLLLQRQQDAFETQSPCCT